MIPQVFYVCRLMFLVMDLQMVVRYLQFLGEHLTTLLIGEVSNPTSFSCWNLWVYTVTDVNGHVSFTDSIIIYEPEHFFSFY